MRCHTTGKRPAQQFANQRQTKTLVLAKSTQGTQRRFHRIGRIRGGVTQMINQHPSRQLLAFVMGHACFALRHDAGRKIEQHRGLACNRNTDAKRIRTKPCITTIPGRNNWARNHVHKVNGDQVLGHRHLGPGSNTA